MSLINCIPGLVEAGKLTPKQGKAAEEAYERHFKRLSRDMGPAAAAAEASEAALNELAYAARQGKRQELLAAKARRDRDADLASYKGESRAKAAMALFDHDGRAPYLNVEALRKTVVGRAHAMMDGILARHSRNLVGEVRDKSGLNDIVRELFGEATGNVSAREMADAFTRTADYLRQRFNAAGGSIGKLEGWGLPQSHDPLKLREAGFEAWRETILPLLARERMIDNATGAPFAADALDDVLREVFDTIRTEGWSKREASGAGGGGKKLANQRADHRFLHFRDAAAWMEYQDRFGGSNAFDAMIGHIESMARDIAHMELLGPHPAATVKWLQQSLLKAAYEGDGKGIDTAKISSRFLQQLFEVTSGTLNAPVSSKWARRFGTVRSLNVAQMLGSATLSAVTDVGFQAVTRAFNGLPLTGAVTGYVKLLNPANAADRQVAVRLGLIAEEAAKLGAGQQRYLGESIGHERSRRLADFVLRSSGLSAWTQAGRWAFGMEMLGKLADERGKGFDGLDRGLRGALERYGIDAEGWDTIRASEPYQHEGAAFLRPEDVADARLADKLHAMVLTETEYAVPTASVRGRALTTKDEPGTFWGEVSRNMFLFKGFGVSVLLNHGGRMMELRGGGRAAYGAGLVITTTLLGALAMQLKEVAKGRDPLPIVDEDGEPKGEFWFRALLQGGGFGIFGDFAAAGTSERSGSLQEAILGPGVGMAADTARLASGNMEEAAYAKRYTPVGSSLWYGRLAYERLFIDELRQWSDEDYASSWERMESKADEAGQGLYWRPGEWTPERAPELGTAFAEPPQE
ncbi:MAG TPA: hypothetical protein VGB70_12705 [Allosphingosinicella sp.]|jgi:hypothetical protein